MKIGLIGCGKLGTNLAWRLFRSGYCVAALSCRNGESAVVLSNKITGCRAFENNQRVADEADLVFLTVSDASIQTVSDNTLWKNGQYLVHCSGVHTTKVLGKAASEGAQVGVFHPLQSFTSFSENHDYFKGIAIALEASGDLRLILHKMGANLGGSVITVPEHFKALYHCSAVLAANYLVVLAGIASRLWENWGVAQEDAVRFLLPLIKGCVKNIETNGINRSLTGPISRGDIDTVIKNIAALSQHAPEFQNLYCELGLEAASMASASRNISIETAAQFKKILEISS